MVPQKTLAALLAVTLVTVGGAVAAGTPPDGVLAGDAQDDKTSDDQRDHRADRASDARGSTDGGSAPERRGPPANVTDDPGPPTDLPERVPEFVGEVHSTVGEFLSGGVDALGDAVRSLTPGGDETSVDGLPAR